MAGVQAGALAVAVSNAGGLGSLPCALLDRDAMRAELSIVTAGTSKPCNVNFFCHVSPAPDAAREAAWGRSLAPYYAELGVDPETIPTGPSRAPFNDDAADILGEFRPAVVSFHFGLPPAALLARVRRWRPTIISSATTVDEARWLDAHGVDAIVAQGLEAGGHRGMFLSDDLTTQIGTFALLPQIIRAVRVPVIAAGGIATADGVAAALRSRRRRRSDRHVVPAVRRSHDECASPGSAQIGRGKTHGAHQRLHRASRAGDRQSPRRGDRAHRAGRATLSAGRIGSRAAAGESRAARCRRILAAVGRTERDRLPARSCRRPHAGARRRS